jgi:hypothetical protein
MAFSLVLFCWIQNSTWNCHEVQLFQFVKLKIIPQPNLLAAGSSLHFAKGSTASLRSDRLAGINGTGGRDHVECLASFPWNHWPDVVEYPICQPQILWTTFQW